MELQFNKCTIECLQHALCQQQTLEQTQEIRISDGLPEIGRILGCWGQVMLRGKEWHESDMCVSGGVNLSILYAPEDGTQPRCVESMIPFQMKWDFQGEHPDGNILVQPLLKSADARGVSPRKIMARVNISCHVQALEPTSKDMFLPGQIPEDVCLLKKSYPLMLPVEAGEKIVQLDDEIQLREENGENYKLLAYWMTPTVTEQRIMADKLIFRGNGNLRMLYSNAEGKVRTMDHQVSYSQYAQLSSETGTNPVIRAVPVLTALELEPGDGKLYMKAGILVQYLVYDRRILDVVEDAYSPRRSVGPHRAQLELPALLDSYTGEAKQMIKTELMNPLLVDCCWRGEFPNHQKNEDYMTAEQDGQLQMLYLDENEQHLSALLRGKLQWQIPSDSNNLTLLYPQPPTVSCFQDPSGMSAQVEMEYYADTFSTEPIAIVTALDLGECKEPDPTRPSLILRSCGNDSVWDLAKDCGSTVDAIMEANHLTQPPLDDRILIIPVI